MSFENAPARTRTLDPLIKSQLLYRLSYKGNRIACNPSVQAEGCKCQIPWWTPRKTRNFFRMSVDPHPR